MRDGLPLILEQYNEEDDSWRADAACRGADPELFYPERFGHGDDVRAAKKICESCPVEMSCLAYAIDTSQAWGIWGGRTERERRRLRKMLRPKLRVVS